MKTTFCLRLCGSAAQKRPEFRRNGRWHDDFCLPPGWIKVKQWDNIRAKKWTIQGLPEKRIGFVQIAGVQEN